MKISTLKYGDCVYWTDPDEGKCSRTYIVKKIKRNGEHIAITDIDDNYIECFEQELSFYDGVQNVL